MDERNFAVIFFDKELTAFAAPYEEQREIWGLRTATARNRSHIVSASTRPQMALMLMLSVAMALGDSWSLQARRREKCGWPSSSRTSSPRCRTTSRPRSR